MLSWPYRENTLREPLGKIAYSSPHFVRSKNPVRSRSPRAAGGYKVENWRVYADITSGAPRIWKVDAMRKGLAYMGDTQFVYGSDCFQAESPRE